MATLAAIGMGVLGAGTAAYGAREQKKAAEAAAAGGQVQPYGQTGEMMDALLNDAWQQFKWGNFQFGPDPNVYNAYLDYGKKLGVPTQGFQRIDPDAGYGFSAYQQMLDFLSGPAWAGATQTNPAAMMGVQDPWVAGLMGGLGGFMGAGGFGGGGGISQAPSGMQIAAIPGSGYVPWNETYLNYGYGSPDGFQLGRQTIQGAVPPPGSGG